MLADLSTVVCKDSFSGGTHHQLTGKHLLIEAGELAKCLKELLHAFLFLKRSILLEGLLDHLPQVFRLPWPTKQLLN